MLSKFKLKSLKQKLWAIVAASFVSRVIMFFILPSTPSSFAPDEGTYAELAKWISESKPANDFPSFGGGLYLSSRSMIIPSSKLIKLGMDELNAVRIISSIYGLLALCTLAYLCSKLLASTTSGVERNNRNEHLVLGLLVVYAFLPSHFVWSNLGLREASNEFWLIITFVAVFLLYKKGQPKKPIIAVLIFISIIGTFSSRPQVGLVLIVSLAIYSIIEIKNKLTFLLIISVFTGSFVGYLATTSFVEVTSDIYIAKNFSTVSTEASKLCNGTQTTVEYDGKSFTCIKSGTTTKRQRTSNVAEVAIDQVEALPGKQIINQVGAASVIQRLDCPLDESSETGAYGCLAYRAPYMTLTFLFRPLPFIDTTSMSSVFAAAENMLWIFMFMLIAYTIYKGRRIPFPRDLSPALIFFTLYVVGAGSYEGNMGTAFRHKSLILWVVLLLLGAVFCKDSQEEHPKHRNKTTESAV